MEQATVTKPARANLAQYITDKDFPLLALAKRRAGNTEFALIVGRDGKVQRCMLIASSGFADLDEQACSVMTDRPQFEPATDSTGKTIPAVVRARIAWVNPLRHETAPLSKKK